MYARTTTMRGDPNRLDEGIALVRDQIVPEVQSMDGCVGVSLLVDRGKGTAIVTSAWDSEDAMRASASRVEPLRQRGAEVLAAQPEVREWEIALLHRERSAPDGACARVTWTRADPSTVDRNVEMFRDHVMPQLGDLDGFCSVSLFVDRESGLGASAVVFRDRASLDGSEQAAHEIRRQAMEQMSLELLDVAAFDVAYAHLRVPETV